MVNLRFKFRDVLRGMVFLLLLAASAAPLVAQVTTLVEPPAPLLPVQFGKWVKAPGSAPVAAGPDAALLSEDGLQRSERGVYRSTANPAETVTVTAYQLVDATGAHAAFSYFLRPGPGYRGPKIGDETGDGYLFRSGVTVISAESKLGAERTNAMLQNLSTRLPKIGGAKGVAPLLPTLLPSKGLRTETVKYALGPVGYQAMDGVVPAGIVGFDKAAEAVQAKYLGEGTLSLFMYPTPQIAGDHERLIEAEMGREGRAAGTVRIRRDGPLLILTTGPWNLAEAQKMVEGVQLHEIVSWNRPIPPSFHSEVQKTYSLLTSIAIFCGLGALAAIVLGLFFGAGRAAIRVLQGKPAASEPEFLRIDLSGVSAKLRTRPGGSEPQA